MTPKNVPFHRPLSDIETLVRQHIITNPGSTQEDIIRHFYNPYYDGADRHREVSQAVIYVVSRFCKMDLPRCTIHFVGEDS
jgi:hypothetical protein